MYSPDLQNRGQTEVVEVHLAPVDAVPQLVQELRPGHHAECGQEGRGHAATAGRHCLERELKEQSSRPSPGTWDSRQMPGVVSLCGGAGVRQHFSES